MRFMLDKQPNWHVDARMQLLMSSPDGIVLDIVVSVPEHRTTVPAWAWHRSTPLRVTASVTNILS